MWSSESIWERWAQGALNKSSQAASFINFQPPSASYRWYLTGSIAAINKMFRGLFQLSGTKVQMFSSVHFKNIKLRCSVEIKSGVSLNSKHTQNNFCSKMSNFTIIILNHSLLMKEVHNDVFFPPKWQKQNCFAPPTPHPTTLQVCQSAYFTI